MVSKIYWLYKKNKEEVWMVYWQYIKKEGGIMVGKIYWQCKNKERRGRMEKKFIENFLKSVPMSI